MIHRLEIFDITRKVNYLTLPKNIIGRYRVFKIQYEVQYEVLVQYNSSYHTEGSVAQFSKSKAQMSPSSVYVRKGPGYRTFKFRTSSAGMIWQLLLHQCVFCCHVPK